MEGETNGQRDPNTHLEHDICIHIFTVSSAMVGVCLTVIGLIRVVITLGRADTLADDLLAGDALLFLISCLLSYWALRSRGLRRMHRLEKIADGIFIVAMIGMVIICAVITYSISVPPVRSFTYEKRAENALKTAQVITSCHNTSIEIH
jgi:cytochrome c oxidase assembly factor CtaG